jgi:hypothetical protein
VVHAIARISITKPKKKRLRHFFFVFLIFFLQTKKKGGGTPQKKKGEMARYSNGEYAFMLFLMLLLVFGFVWLVVIPWTWGSTYTVTPANAPSAASYAVPRTVEDVD